MTLNEIRVLIQDKIKELWDADHSDIPAYFYTVVADPVRKPCFYTRIDFGNEVKKDIGASTHLFRLVGVITCILYTPSNTKNSVYDSCLETIRKFHQDQPFAPVLIRDCNIGVRSRGVDYDITISTLTFQVDTFA